jgi:hypothetical protein
MVMAMGHGACIMLVQGNALMSGFTAIRLSWSVANDGHIDLRLANHPADRRVPPHAGSDNGPLSSISDLLQRNFARTTLSRRYSCG